MREFTCIVCGNKAIDRGYRQAAKYCGEKCRNRARYYADIEARSAASACMFNEGVICYKRNCENCGWNPVVDERRKEALYGQQTEDE